MRVMMLDSETGTVWPEQIPVHMRAGQCYDVPDRVGEKWLRIGLAEAAPVEAVEAVQDDDAHKGTTTKGAPKRATRISKGD